MFVGTLCLVLVFLIQYLASFLVCNYLAEEESVGCFINCIVTVSVLWLLLTEPWAGLRCV